MEVDERTMNIRRIRVGDILELALGRWSSGTVVRIDKYGKSTSDWIVRIHWDMPPTEQALTYENLRHFVNKSLTVRERNEARIKLWQGLKK